MLRKQLVLRLVAERGQLYRPLSTLQRGTKVEKGSQEAKDRMAKVRAMRKIENVFEKGSLEAKDYMSKIRGMKTEENDIKRNDLWEVFEKSKNNADGHISKADAEVLLNLIRGKQNSYDEDEKKTVRKARKLFQWTPEADVCC